MVVPETLLFLIVRLIGLASCLQPIRRTQLCANEKGRPVSRATILSLIALGPALPDATGPPGFSRPLPRKLYSLTERRLPRHDSCPAVFSNSSHQPETI